MRRQLDREVTDASRSTVHEHVLPLLDGGMVDERLPRRERTEGKRCRCRMVGRCRLGRQLDRWHGDVLGRGAWAVEADQSIHLVASA
jgi:hypothetical protein